MPFRPEDEALVARLEEEAVYARLFREHAGPTAPEPPRRAAGLLHELRALPGGRDALVMAGLAAGPDGPAPERDPLELPSAALDGLTALLTAPSFAGYPPALLHHLGLHFARVAGCRERELARRAAQDALDASREERGAREREGGGARRELGPVEAWELSLAAFFALSRCTDYLAELVTRALGPATSGAVKTRAADVARLSAELPFLHVGELGERALAGARARDARARIALMALARAEAAAARAGLDEAARGAAVARCAAAHARAIEEALEPTAQALDDAALANELTTRGIAALQGLVEVWELSGQDEAVERFFVERAEPVCWELQRRREWDKFAQLFGPDAGPHGAPARAHTFRLVESLIARVTGDRGRVAYAAACAQFLVFYTNAATTLDRQIAIVERAVAVCPSHRNGRAVLASFLCQKARRKVETLVASGAEIDEAEALVARARDLFPSAREVEETAALVRARRTGALPRLP